MPSRSFTERLNVVLTDATELLAAHARLRTGKRGRPWGLGALNRAVVVMCVAAWESYVEEVVKEYVEALRPTGLDVGPWPSLKASVDANVKRFNTPNAGNVRNLIASAGVSDITVSWRWQNFTKARAIQSLDDLLKTRHETAHGQSPRPAVDLRYASWIPVFITRLAEKTDEALALNAAGLLGGRRPW